MTLRRLSLLQWFGVLGAAAAAAGQFLSGTVVSIAACNPGSHRWGIPHDTVQLSLLLAGALLVLAAEAAAIAVFRATRGIDDEGAPPQGRLHFFATAAIAANVIFLMIVLLTGIGVLSERVCRQA